MRIIHTSDWHLGQKFISQSRETEQQMALDWLLAVITNHAPDVLVISGDIFDVNNPPVGAEEMYYQFLTRLTATPCRCVVITGGNHDSPFKLNAPRGLLRALNMHVVGAATANPADAIIPLTSPDGHTEALFVAVPFLRERDFNVTTTGETADDRIRRIQEGIAAYYQQMAAAAGDFKGAIIATGHLYAKGASTHEEQQNIYLGNLDNIAAEAFPERFDYIALGHIHRMQKVGKQSRIRYCGSLIPLSFSEKQDKKGVLVVDFTPEGRLQVVQELEAPVFRRLLTIKGSMAEIEQKLEQAHDPEATLPAWVEVVITGDPGMPMVDRYLRDFSAQMHLEILKVKVERSSESLSEQVIAEDLATLTPEEVFIKKCASSGLDAERTDKMLREFTDLRQWMEQQ